MKLSIHNEGKTLTAIGKNQCELLLFAARYPDKWHSYAKDKKTENTVLGLLKRGSIKLNGHRQFKVNY